MSTPERLEAILQNVAERFADVEVLKTAVRREGRAYALSVTIDREGGVDTALCERITRFIDQRVEAEKFDAALGPYTVEVGSAGLDRPLLAPAHYRRFIGHDARIITSLRVHNRARPDHRRCVRGRRRAAHVARKRAGSRDWCRPSRSSRNARRSPSFGRVVRLTPARRPSWANRRLRPGTRAALRMKDARAGGRGRRPKCTAASRLFAHRAVRWGRAAGFLTRHPNAARIAKDLRRTGARVRRASW